MDPFLDEPLDPLAAADFLKLSRFTLDTMRSRGGGPAYHKRAGRVRYLRRDLLAWLAAGRHETTAREITREAAA